jgi:hypothetical protein
VIGVNARCWGAGLAALVAAACALWLLLPSAAGAFTDGRIQFFDYCEVMQGPLWCTTPGLYAVSVAGKEPTPELVLGDGAGYNSQYSENGTKMVYEYGEYHNAGTENEYLTVSGLAVTSLSGGGFMSIANAEINDGGSVSISPNGKQVVFGFANKLWIANTEGEADEREVGMDNVCGSYPYWAAANAIVFSGCYGDEAEHNEADRLEVVNPENPKAGAHYVPVTFSEPSASGFGNFPSAAPGGKTYYSAAKVDGTEGIWSVPAAGGAPTLVVESPTAFPSLSESAEGSNGHLLYYDQAASEHPFRGAVFEDGNSDEINPGDPNTEDFPTWAPPKGPGAISGIVTGPKGEGLAGATITIKPNGSGAAKAATTESSGKYSVEEEPGTYTVEPSGVPTGQPTNGAYSPTACSGAKAAKPPTCTVEVGQGGSATASFSYETGFKLFGKITYEEEENEAAKGVTVTVSGRGESKSAVTNENGEYELRLQEEGSYKVEAEPKFAPKVKAGSECAGTGASCTAELGQANPSRSVNFTIGCSPELDFHTSMVATGCFIPVNPREGTWRAKGKFRMDGIDFESPDDKSEPVIFNEQSKSVDGKQVKMSLSAPGWGGGWLAFYVPGGLHLTFPFSEEKSTFALSTPWSTPGDLAMKSIGFLAAPLGGSSTIFGFPAHAPAVELSFTPGQTTLNMQLTFPPSTQAFLDPINGLWKVPTASGDARIAYPLAFRAKITAENKGGVSTIAGSFSPSAAYGFDTNNEKFVRTTGPPTLGTVELARVGFNWELEKGVLGATALLVVHNKASAAAVAFAKPLEGFLGKTLVNVEASFKWLTALEVFGHPVPLPGLVHASWQVNNINKYVPDTPGVFWQRWGVQGGIDPTNPLGKYEIGGNLGFTWLPRFKSDYLWFTEVLALDGEGAFDFDPFAFKGALNLKAINATILHGQAKLNHSGLEAEGEFGLNLNQVLRVGFPASIKGTGQLLLPTTGPVFLGGWQLAARGAVNIWSLSANGEFLLNGKGAGICVSSNKLGGRRGVYFDGEWHVGGCNSGPFGPAKSSGASSSPEGSSGEASSSAAAGRHRSFMLTGRSRVSAVAVAGAGAAPRIELEGPGAPHLKLAAGAGEAISSPVSLIANAGDHTTYILFAHDVPGRYRIVQLPGSAPVTGVRFSAELAPVSVAAHVRAASCKRVLTWRLRSEPGQRVELLERDPNGLQPLASTDAARGKRVFTPLLDSDPRREILARVLQQGTPRATLTVARFHAPTGTERVAHLRGRIAKGKLKLSWRPVCAAAEYDVTIGSGSQVEAVTATGSHTTVSVGTARSVPVSVAAVAPNGQAGKATGITAR